MIVSDEELQGWRETLLDWVRARWRWLIVVIALLFAFNKIVGVVVGITGLLAFANGVAGRFMKARRVVQQVQQIVTDPVEFREEAAHKRPGTRPDPYS